ncbi:MAG: VWA domain-containing protein [Candidatus Binataceae bacterium]|jgi:hypothetical protein
MTSVTSTDNTPIRTAADGQHLALPKGRLIFALDATQSREATWAIARTVTADMFRAAAPVGKLDVKLMHFRGGHESPASCRYSKWVGSGEQLVQLINKIDCQSGPTQIGKVLNHALDEIKQVPVGALVFIGDAMEEDLETLAAQALKLGNAGCPIYIFHEDHRDLTGAPDTRTRNAFKLLALKSGGEYFEFSPATSRAVDQLTEQLGAVARLAVGDTEALERIAATALTDQRG